MPGLSFNNQSRQLKTPGWIVPVVLVVLSILLMTFSARSGGTGAFAVVRSGVQTIANPIQGVCSVVSTPFKSVGVGSEVVTADEARQLEQENAQLRNLIAELEEYRQQDLRLTTLLQISDAYALQSVSAKVVGRTDGWTRTTTIDKGSSAGIRIGMGVISSCGLYGQVVSVTPNTAVVRTTTDAHSSVSAMVQSSRARGILNGSYDGELTLEYVPIGSNIAEGDIIITSGEGGAYPSGIVIGTVKNVETDSSKLYYRVNVDPLTNLNSCEEVLVLTGNEDETATILDEKTIESLQSGATSPTENAKKTEDAQQPAAPASSGADDGKDVLSAQKASEAERLQQGAPGGSGDGGGGE